MIVNFHHPGVEAFFRDGQTHGVQAGHARKLGMVLAMLDAARDPQELNQSALRLEPAQNGLWSAWVSGNWWISFRFVGVDISVIDYWQLKVCPS